MQIVVIGGLDRMHGEYAQAVKHLGVELKCLTGKEKDLSVRIGNPSCVVFCTSIISHRALREVRSTCDAREVPVHIVRGAGVNHIRRGVEAAIGELA